VKGFEEFQHKLETLEKSNVAYARVIDFTKPSVEYSQYIEWQEAFSQLQKLKKRRAEAQEWLQEDGKGCTLPPEFLTFRREDPATTGQEPSCSP
jgi:hypothetical protein